MIVFNNILPHLPPILRGVEQWRAWLRVLSAPLQTVSNAVDSYENALRYELQFNSQVIYLEHRLNDAFDNALRRIYIDDPLPTDLQPTIVTNRADNQPTLIVRNRDEASTETATFYNIVELQTRWDFVVFVPTSIHTTYQNAMRSTVNYYRVAGKIWTFQTF